MSTGVPYGVDLRISGATSTKTEAQTGRRNVGPNQQHQHLPIPRFTSPQQGVGLLVACRPAGLGKDTLALYPTLPYFLRLLGTVNFTDGKSTDRQRDGIEERLQDFVERQKACLVVKPLADPSNVVSVMPNLSPYATTALIASHLVSCHLTSWCAALGLEQLRAGIVLLRKAKVGDLEVGVVLLVHQEQVLRLKRGASKKKKRVARK